MPFPNYTIATELLNGLTVSRLHSEIVALGISSAAFLGVTSHEGVCSVVFDTTPNATDQASVDGAVAAHDPGLADAKKAKLEAIDARTDELIAGGFVYASRLFSMSMPAQIRMIGISQVKGNPAVTYPIAWNTKDDSDVYQVANANDLEGMYLTALGTYRAHVDAGTALKDQVRAATTVSEVDAIVDTR